VLTIVVFPPFVVHVSKKTVVWNDVVVVRAGISPPSGLPFRVLDFPCFALGNASGIHDSKVLAPDPGKLGFLGLCVCPAPLILQSGLGLASRIAV